MSVTLGDRVLDVGLTALDTECDKIHVCSSTPTDYADTLTKSLGNKNFGAGNAFGSPAAGSPDGRKVTSAAITDGSVTASGTVACWAAVDSSNSRLLATGSLTGGMAVTNTWVFTLDAFAIHLPVATAVATTTWDPANVSDGSNSNNAIVLSNGNLTAEIVGTIAGSPWGRALASASSGKKYHEITINVTTNPAIIFVNSSINPVISNADPQTNTNSIGYGHNGDVGYNSSYLFIAGFTVGDTVGAAIDLDAKLVWFRTNNGAWNAGLGGTQDPATGQGGISYGITGAIFPAFNFNNDNAKITANFGATSYANAAPSGFGNW